jgi:5-methyltetrahydrofolate--homocysteine methyltransferase
VTVFPETPADMAAHVPALLAAGANIIGGCCGTTPDHIRALRQALNCPPPA